MTAALLEAAGLSVGAVHQPAPRAGQRAHRLERRADRRRRARRACSSRWPTVEDLLPDAPSYFEILTAAALTLVRRRRGRRRGGRGRAGRHVGRHQRGRRRRRGRHQREHRPRRVPRADAGRDRGREGGDRRAGRRRSCSARPIPSSCRSSPRASPASVAACATRDFGVRAQRLAHRRPARSTSSRRTRRTTTCSSRCTARTRPTTRRSRSPRPSAFLGAPLDAELVARRVRAACARRAGSRSSGTSRSCCSTARTTSPARTRSRAALAEEFADSAAHARRRAAAREGPARDARRARRLDAARSSCAAAPTARAARPADVVADAAFDLGVDREHRRRDRRRARGGRPSRSRSRPPTARSSSPARSTSSSRRPRPVLVGAEVAPAASSRPLAWPAHERPAPSSSASPTPSSAASSARSSAASSARASRSWRSSCARSTPTSPGATTTSTASKPVLRRPGRRSSPAARWWRWWSKGVPTRGRSCATSWASTNPREAAPGTIRGDLALETGENLVHGSDGPESAAREIALFFPRTRVSDRARAFAAPRARGRRVR